MPLSDSGSALFAGTAAEFVQLAPRSELTAHLTREFNRRWGTVGDSEIAAWRASLSAIAAIVSRAGLPHAGVGVELKLPLTDKRVDVSFVGRSQSEPSVVLVELKQWEAAGPSAFPDNVVVGAREMLHPSIQVAAYAQYLRDSHSAFSQDGFRLAACAYLHNMSGRAAEALGRPTAEDLEPAPVYSRDDAGLLQDFLTSNVEGVDGEALLQRVVHGTFRPSKALLDGIEEGLSSASAWTLLDEQRLAFNLIRGLAQEATESDEKTVILVRGGPGTGKSVVAAHAALELARAGKRVVHATGSKAFTTNLRALVQRGRGEAFFRYFNAFNPTKTEENELDVLIADEAHRIRTSSNGRFTPAVSRSPLPQVEELIRVARVSVFFLDQLQNVRPTEIGSPDAIRAAASRLGARIHEVELTAQFRCGGCGPYIEWIDALMSDSPSPPGNWLRAREYEFRLFRSVYDLEGAIVAHARAGASARLVAGFCWPWSDPMPNGDLVPDVQIEDWARPWNEKPPEQRRPPRPQPPPKRHPYTRWATEPERVREVGCIYSAQGFEFDYCGVILGPDLVWRGGRGWVSRREESEDPEIKRRRLEPEQLTSLLQHTYRVLLTRGIKGTLVYSVDEETQVFLHRLLVN